MKQIEIKLKRSLIGRNPKQREALRCLGLKKINQVKKHPNTKATWGQIRKIFHMVECSHPLPSFSKKIIDKKKPNNKNK